MARLLADGLLPVLAAAPERPLVFVNIAGGPDLGLFEVNEAMEIIHGVAHPDANIIFGNVIDDAMTDEVRVTVIAAGFERWEEGRRGEPRPEDRSQVLRRFRGEVCGSFHLYLSIVSIRVVIACMREAVQSDSGGPIANRTAKMGRAAGI